MENKRFKVSLNDGEVVVEDIVEETGKSYKTDCFMGIIHTTNEQGEEGFVAICECKTTGETVLQAFDAFDQLKLKTLKEDMSLGMQYILHSMKQRLSRGRDKEDDN